MSEFESIIAANYTQVEADETLSQNIRLVSALATHELLTDLGQNTSK